MSFVPKPSISPKVAPKEPITIELDAETLVTISVFYKKIRVDIRKTYIEAATGERKFSNKGINLTVEQFNALVALIPGISAAIRTFC
jgi:hypothetical protein